jgi:hypothetical protein
MAEMANNWRLCAGLSFMVAVSLPKVAALGARKGLPRTSLDL